MNNKFGGNTNTDDLKEFVNMIINETEKGNILRSLSESNHVPPLLPGIHFQSRYMKVLVKVYGDVILCDTTHNATKNAYVLMLPTRVDCFKSSIFYGVRFMLAEATNSALIGLLESMMSKL